MLHGSIDTDKSEDDQEDYLLSLTPPQQRAYQRVKLFIASVGKPHWERSCQAHLNLKQVHEYFPVFAKRMGWRGGMYTAGKDGRCAAVSIRFRDDMPGAEESFWMILPRQSYRRNTQKVDEHPQHDKLIQAAKEILNLWLPDWKW